MTVIPRGSWPDTHRHAPIIWTPRLRAVLAPLTWRRLLVVLAVVAVVALLAAVAVLDGSGTTTDLQDAGRFASAPVHADGRFA